MTIQTSPRLHLHVLLDRSGSMEPMRDDVIAGFNGLLAEQKAATANGGLEPRLTLVQFDDVDAADVTLDAMLVSKAPMLSRESFEPRGMTPLLDATSTMLKRASRRVSARVKAERPAEAIVIVTITDGDENASQRTTRKALLRQVRKREADGWTFVFLGAGLDAYAEAGTLGYDHRSVQAWAPDGAGATAAFDSVSKATLGRRTRLASGVAIDTADYFEGAKTAEADRHRRTGRP